ncbi:MAG: hypothetical protein Q9174_001097 [Haloplaca sp. 1 TL-2023]
MPSFLENHISEDVNLSANEFSLYEPPQRKSQDQSWFYGARPLGNIPDGRPNGGVRAGKSIPDASRTRSVHDESKNVQSLPNGTSSGSTDRLGNVESKGDSSHTLPTAASDAQEQYAGADSEHDCESKPSAVNKHLPPMDTSHTQPAKADRPLSRRSHDGSDRRFGHARGHSLSAPQNPSSSIVQKSGPETAQSGPRTDSGPPATRSEETSTNRFSSPPTLPQSSSITPSSSGTPMHPGAVRLQHRHTLQVPKLATGRVSRDFSAPLTSSPDQIPVDPERLSPTHTGRGSTSLVGRPTRSIHSDMYLDEIPQDDEMARWTETIRQKRASRRKRKDEEEDDRVVVGTKVDVNHVNWVTAYNMLTGIRFTVSRTNAKIDRDLTDGDFDARHKFSFDM